MNFFVVLFEKSITIYRESGTGCLMTIKNSMTLNDHSTMPRLGFGVYKVAQNEANQVVSEAIKCGYRLIDTASMYQNEEGVGEAIASSNLKREDFFVTTKLWNDDQGIAKAFRALDMSLLKLGLSHIDLYLIHWPSPQRASYVETWKALIEMQKQGKIKSIGVSNFAIEHLEKIIKETRVVPAVNQIELHPRFQQKALRAFHEKHGIKTESWGPLGRGKFLENKTLISLAAKHHKTPAQIVLRWHLQSDLIAIPKSSNAKRIKENFDIFDFALDSQDMNAIEALDSPFGRTGPHPLQTDF